MSIVSTDNTQVATIRKNLPKVRNKTLFVGHKEVQKKFVIVDVEGLVLGRVAAILASILRGKNKPCYTPQSDCGDSVIVINAEKIALTGSKEICKKYYHHTGYPGGIKERTVKFIRSGKTPEFLVKHAVKGMMGSGPMAYKRMRNLHVFCGTEHGMEAQKPTPLDIRAMSRKNSSSE